MMEMKDEFNYIKDFSIDSMNLEEIFWNLNKDYLNEDLWMKRYYKFKIKLNNEWITE